jgi:hypothetical protein
LLLAAIAATIAIYLLLRETRVEETGISFEPVSFADIEGWQDDDQAAAFQALLKSCGRIKRDSALAEACAAARDLAARGQVSRDAARAFFETHYTPNKIVGAPNMVSSPAITSLRSTARARRATSSRQRPMGAPTISFR